MPVSESAKRALRKAERRREINLHHLSKMKEAIRLFKKKLSEINNNKQMNKEDLIKELEAELRKVVSIISHTASKGVIHKNEASRRISRITKFYNKLLKENAKLLKEDAKQGTG